MSDLRVMHAMLLRAVIVTPGSVSRSGDAIWHRAHNTTRVNPTVIAMVAAGLLVEDDRGYFLATDAGRNALARHDAARDVHLRTRTRRVS